MRPFIERQGDWKIVKLSDLKARLKAINASCLLAMILYLYGNPAYSTIYNIMEPYQNNTNWPKTPTND